MTNRFDPLEQRMISDLPSQLEQAVRPFDAAAIARVAAADGRPSVMRITAVAAVVAIAAIAAVVAVERLTGLQGQPGSPGTTQATSTSSASPPSAGLDQLAAIQRADRIISSNLSAEENALIVNAHSEVVESCMQRLGWDIEFPMATAEDAGAGPGFLSNLDQWTFADVASAQTIGYGFEAHLAEVAAYLERLGEAEGEARIPDQATMSAEDSARFEVEYFGTEEERIEITERDGSGAGQSGGGCLGEAQRALYGDIEQEMWLRDARGTAESDIWVATESDEAVGQALDSWRECVGQRGFRFEDPHGALDAAADAAQSGDFDREREIATTDAECKAESNLDLAVAAAYLSATNAVLPALEDDLLALQQLEQEALARAKDILGVEGP